RLDLIKRFPETDRLRFSVIALGKWGGGELNYASDIDLMFVYEPEGLHTEKARRLALRIATGFIQSLATPTAEGIAFRVDADLRPEGSTGPLVRTLESYRNYYQRWGESWEYQALLKARHAAGDDELGRRFEAMAAHLIWPNELSPDMVRQLRQLKTRAEEEADPDDLKRAPGGIRDVEFSVQLLQIIHGRADQTLRKAGTLQALAALAAGGYVKSTDAEALADSYRFLRTVEHRIQLWQMAQTHRIPDDRERLALVMNYRSGEVSATEQFTTDLNMHRTRVRQLHEEIYYRPLLEAFTSPSVMGLPRSKAAERLAALGFADVEGAGRAFEELTAGLSRRSRLMQQLLPLMVDWLAATPNPDLGLHQLATLVSSSTDQAELTGTLRDRPLAAQRLCRLLGSSRWVGTFLDRIPEFLPRLADDRMLLDLPNHDLGGQALERMYLRPDRIARMASLRRLVRRRMLRVAAADLLDLVDVDQVSQALTDAADAASQAALWTAAQETGTAGVATVAMGKWGGRELGYGSDLDLVFVSDTEMDNQAALRLAMEFGAIIGQPTADGVAYEVDAALRPEGNRGALARTIEAYRSYYATRAEPWERLALIKARTVAGDKALEEQFDSIRAEEAFPARVSVEMLRSIRHIKARVERERVPRGEDPEFHLKLGRGGMSDIEFVTQLWQLRLGHAYPVLRTTGTLAGVQALSEVGALEEWEAVHLAATYRLCTRLRNRLYLQTGRQHDALPVDGDELARLAESLGYNHRGELREEYRAMTRRSRRIFEKRFFEG
ncbi:MAG: bifunctional [glutamine synthetase] adenylyltransferase/[glutamine synthetase]-adenylyl-L-tyrosine phosphorylase, partial [Actinomycetota bacterium]